jgi:hypothetical protein
MRNKRRITSLLSVLGMDTPLTARFADGNDDPSTDKGTGGGAPASDKITLSKADYEALVAAKSTLDNTTKERDTLKGRWENTTKILRADLPAAEKADALRAVLKDAGYSERAIQTYLAQNLGDDDDTDDEPTPRNRRGRQRPDEDEDEDDERSRDLATIKQQQEHIIEQQRSMRLRELQNILETETSRHLNSKTGLGDVLSKLRASASELEGESAEGVNGTIEEITKEFKDRVTSQLHARKQATGRFDESWFAEEAKKASDALAKKYRPLVIPHPSRLGRSGETDGPDDFLLPDKPVDLPDPKKRMSAEDLKMKVTDWATDKLLRSLKGSGSPTQI